VVKEGLVEDVGGRLTASTVSCYTFASSSTPMTEPDIPTTCARHPKVASNLRCASCGVYICPRCLVQTPVGAKCPSCAAQASGSLFRPTLWQLTAAAAVGLSGGIVAGWAVQFSFGLLTLVVAFAYAAFLGEMILRASGRRRGIRMELTAVLSVIVGAIGGRIVIAALLLSKPGLPRPPYGVLEVLVDLFIPSPIPALGLVILVVGLVSRVRYL